MNNSTTIGYARVSSQNQSNNTSLPHQKQKIEEYCKLNDLELTEVYSEVDSGGKDDRVVLGMIKELIQSNSITTCVCFKMDRLGRNSDSWWSILKILVGWRVNLYVGESFKPYDFTSHTDRLVIGILSYFTG